MGRLEQLRANLEASREPEEAEEAVEAPEPVEAEGAEAPEAAAEAVQGGGQQGKPMETVSPESARDDKGRFQKPVKPTPSKLGEAEKQRGQAQAKPDKAAAPGQQQAAQPGASLRPPPNWKPQAKEHWEKLPREVQEESLRVHKEAAKALSDSAGARDFHGQFQQVMAPFAGMLAADRAQPLQAIQNVFQTVAALRTGTQGQRDAIIAGIIRDFGGSTDGINAHLSGQAPAQTQRAAPQPAQFRDPRLDELLARQEAHLSQTAASEVDDFVSQNEFMDDMDFRTLVADIIDNSRNTKRPLTMEQAYEVAKQIDPNVKSVLSQRQAASEAKAQLAATRRSQAAASSVKSQPAGMVQVSDAGGPKSRREMLASAAARARGEE